MTRLIDLRPFEGKRLLITGGTGSFGQRLVRRILTGEMGNPAKVVVFSRDEAKQHSMRVEYECTISATDEIVYENFRRRLQFVLGDVRDFHSLATALPDIDIVFNAAGMKQVPACEYFPYEATQTNIGGAENLIRVIHELRLPVETVVGISTDKACKPVNVMGMTKAVQERVFIQANLRVPRTRFLCVRYGNVLASRGSVIPLFHDQIRSGGPVTVTTEAMTRFLLSLDDAVDTVFAAFRFGRRGEIFVPRAPSARIIDVAKALIGERKVEIAVTGIRPGEKIHEVMVSEEEALRAHEVNKWYAVAPMLPELIEEPRSDRPLGVEYSSEGITISKQETFQLLQAHDLLVSDFPLARTELLA